MRAGNRSTIVQLSFNYRSTIVQLSFTIVHRSNESRQSFNYRSTIVQLSFSYRSTIVQLSFNYRSTIVRWTERNQMRAGNRATFVQIIVQARVALSWFWGAFWEFCSVLPFFVFLWFFSTTNVVEQREIPKTNLAGVKPFEKIDSRPFSGWKTLCVHLLSALRKPLYHEKCEVLSIKTHFMQGLAPCYRSLAFFLGGGSWNSAVPSGALLFQVALQTYTMWVRSSWSLCKTFVCPGRSLLGRGAWIRARQGTNLRGQTEPKRNLSQIFADFCRFSPFARNQKSSQETADFRKKPQMFTLKP